MAKKDYYETLGITKNASESEIKKAYRSKAKELHPDRNSGSQTAEEDFKAVNEAYEILKDPNKKSAYDQYGHAAFENGGFGGGGSDFSSAFSDVFEDLFGDFMGGSSRRESGTSSKRGSDLRYNMSLTLEEAFKGKSTNINVPSSVKCDPCEGTGGKDGTKPASCPTCGGLGKVRAQQGFFTVERTCPTCAGRGQVNKNPCRFCSGSGTTRKNKNLSVNIPAGVETGTRIRLTGEGEAGFQNGPPGDLYIFTEVLNHAIFQRESTNLFCQIPISIVTATLGGEIDSPTLDGGKTRVKIPSGVQHGKQLRLRGKGMPSVRGNSFGDLYIELVIETPVNLNQKQKDILKEFEETLYSDSNNNPAHNDFFSKVKRFWEKSNN
ncbi:molecular chaperone DnaJ [bacterium TMED277]|nr:MAG: molecular chaperone DnaJ [bacterium TMED277]|tara:strand:- start:2269 stop:3405 length:1137 start_codon:yes stop_codon:yes gene_type:complete